MRKSVITITAAAIGSLALAGTASAATLPALQKTQISRVNVCAPSTKATVVAAGFTDAVNNFTGLPAATGDGVADNWGRVCAKPKNSAVGIIDAYLSTRYQSYHEFGGPALNPVTGRPETPNRTRQGAPVGAVKMTFPTGSTFQPYYFSSTNSCNVAAGLGQKIIDTCAKAMIGTGWAHVNTGQALGCTVTIPTGLNCALAGGVEIPTARTQLAGAPDPCASEVATSTDSTTWNQYTQTFDANGVDGCVPWGHLYNKVRVYSGIIPEGKTKIDKCSVAFVSQNAASVVSFSGQLTGAGTTAERAAGKKCGNVLTVNLPRLWGSGSYPGELFFGWTLVDFRVILSGKNAFKAGSTSCKSSNMAVRSQISYSQRKFEDGVVNATPASTTPNGEDVRPAPAAFDGTTNTAC